MKNFKICIFIITFLLSAMSQASSFKNDDNWNIKLFNDSNQDRYYVITDLTFVDPESHPEMMGKLSAGGQTSIVLNRNENHQAGRIFLSDKPIPYTKGSAPALGGEYNFVEYNVGFDPDKGFPFTDYDVSAVDSLYGTPFALEAVYKDGHSDGWVGMSESLSQSSVLSDAINSFTKATGWPTFIDNITKTPAGKIPGAYNMFAISADQLSPEAVTERQKLLSRWMFWTSDTPANTCKNSQTKERSFDDCVAFAKTVQFFKPAPLTNDLLAGLYGYVNPYNYDGSPYAPYVIALLRGLSYDGSHEDTNPAHLYPEYDSIYCLNPYVTFIHKYLGLQIYSFSIDDSIGNIYQPDMQDLYIDLGSHANLPNKTPYKPIGPTPPSDFVLSYAPNWGGSKFVIGTVTASPTDASGVVPFNLKDFDPSTHKLTISVTNNTLVFSGEITVGPATKLLAKANCQYRKTLTSPVFSDPSCNDFTNDWLGAEMNIDNIGHAIILPPGK